MFLIQPNSLSFFSFARPKLFHFFSRPNLLPLFSRAQFSFPFPRPAYFPYPYPCLFSSALTSPAPASPFPLSFLSCCRPTLFLPLVYLLSFVSSPFPLFKPSSPSLFSIKIFPFLLLFEHLYYSNQSQFLFLFRAFGGHLRSESGFVERLCFGF